MAELRELLIDDLRDILDAEKQMTKSLPKLAKVSETQELKQAMTDHLEMTRNQITRLERVFEILGERAKSKPCRAMKGLIEEANEHISEHEKGKELDSVIIASSQKAEHYEIAAYGTVRAMAKSIGEKEVVGLLTETLKEEEMTDKLLTKIALQIQKEMLREEGESEEGVEEQIRERSGGMQKRGGRGGGGAGMMEASEGRGGRGAAASKKKKVAAKKAGGNKRGGSAAGTQVTTDHDEIREWAESRGAKPSCVKGTGKGEVGMIRLDFPGYSGGDSLQEISWDDWFEKFDENNLALLYQEKTARGQTSNFNKLVSRETAEMASAGSGGSRKKSAGRRR